MAVPIDLAGRRALVTGAGSGIGRACAKLLAQAGADVVVADIDITAARACVAGIVADGGAATVEAIDISSPRDCAELAAKLQPPNAIDVLVNCAAIWTLGPFEDMPATQWRRDLEVTLAGPMILTAALFAGMMSARGNASIVNIGSDAGRIGEPGQVAYSAAKAGVIGFTKALAREVGHHGIRVNCVAPGLTRTEGSAAYINAMPTAQIVRRYPLGRVGEPLDIANLVLFLASDLASWITGQVISVNGGYATAG